VFVEKHISGIMCKNMGGARPPCPPLPTSMIVLPYRCVSEMWSGHR